MIDSNEPSLRYRWVILGISWLAYMIAFFQRLSIGPLAPFLKTDLGLTNTQVGLLVSFSALGYGLALAPAGWLVDRIGVRRMLVIGEIVAGIFVSGMFFISTFTQGAIFMTLSGIGLGCILPATTKAIFVWFPTRERATAMGFKQTGVNVGGIITASTLPALALAIGWQYGFICIGFIAIATGIASFILYKEPPSSAGSIPSEPIPANAPASPTRELFKHRDIWLVSVAAFALCFIEFSVMTHFVVYLKDVLLFPVITAGFLLAFLEGSGAFGKPISGLISDRLLHGKRKWILLSMSALTCAMCLIFVFLRQGSPFWIFIPVCLIIGAAGIGWGGLYFAIVGEFAGKKQAGTVFGISSLFLITGSMIGPPVFGYAADLTGSYQAGWQLLAIIAAVATLLIFLMREGKRKL